MLFFIYFFCNNTISISKQEIHVLHIFRYVFNHICVFHISINNMPGCPMPGCPMPGCPIATTAV